MKNSNLKSWLCFPLHLRRTQKILYAYNFVAPLKLNIKFPLLRVLLLEINFSLKNFNLAYFPPIKTSIFKKKLTGYLSGRKSTITIGNTFVRFKEVTCEYHEYRCFGFEWVFSHIFLLTYFPLKMLLFVIFATDIYLKYIKIYLKRYILNIFLKFIANVQNTCCLIDLGEYINMMDIQY